MYSRICISSKYIYFQNICIRRKVQIFENYSSTAIEYSMLETYVILYTECRGKLFFDMCTSNICIRIPVSLRPWLVVHENGYVKFQKVRIRKFSVCHRLSFADTEKLFRFRNKTVSIAYGSDFLLTYIFMGFLCPQYWNFQSY